MNFIEKFSNFSSQPFHIPGCEMLYVIDQRLKAQGISLEKSAQGNSRFLLFVGIAGFFLFLIL